MPLDPRLPSRKISVTADPGRVNDEEESTAGGTTTTAADDVIMISESPSEPRCGEGPPGVEPPSAGRRAREQRAFRPAALARRGRVEPLRDALPAPSRGWLLVGWAAAGLLLSLAGLLLSHAVTWSDLRRALMS